MPRPLNWVRGEGTVKNQRWGLGFYMDTPFIPRGLGNAAFAPFLYRGMGDVILSDGSRSLTAPCPGSPGCPGYVSPGIAMPDVEQQIADVWDYVFTNAPVNYDSVTQVVTGDTVGSFVVKNWLPIAGGLVALLMLARR